MSEKKKRKILVADDEECVRFTFQEILSEAGYEVSTAGSLHQCLAAVETATFDLVYLDVHLGANNGIEAIKKIKELQPHCEIVIITGNHEAELIGQATRNGARDYLVKPIREPSLIYNTSKILK